MWFLRPWCAFWALLVIPVGVLEASTITVTTAADTLASDGDCSLREAIYAANNNMNLNGDCTSGSQSEVDVVVLAAQTTYTLSRTGGGEDAGFTGDLDITESVRIEGQGSSSTVIDAGGIDRIFDIDPNGIGGVTVQISDLTVQNGSALGAGGIFNLGDLTLRDVIVTNNDAKSGTEVGGGIKNVGGGTLTMQRGELSNNQSFDKGGGLYNDSATATLTDVTISNNSADSSGGGIYNDSTLTISGSDCHTNTSAALAGGGCLFNDSDGDATIGKTVIRSNTADSGSGGGIRNEGTATLKNVTISGNSATSASGRGGGYYHFSDTTHLQNVTIANNTAASSGGGLKIRDGTVNLSNTLIGSNTDNGNGFHDCDGTFTSRGYNLIEDISGCTIQGDTTGNITGQDPGLSTLVDGTHALSSSSPAVDAGNPATPGSEEEACEIEDQDDVTRPQGDACDIGAYELVSTGSNDDDDDNDDDDAGDDDDDNNAGDDDDDNGAIDDDDDATGGAGHGDDDDSGVLSHSQGGTIDCSRSPKAVSRSHEGPPSLWLLATTLFFLGIRRRFPPS